MVDVKRRQIDFRLGPSALHTSKIWFRIIGRYIAQQQTEVAVVRSIAQVLIGVLVDVPYRLLVLPTVWRLIRGHVVESAPVPSYSGPAGVSHVAARWKHLACIVIEYGICVVECVVVAAMDVAVFVEGDPGWVFVALGAHD